MRTLQDFSRNYSRLIVVCCVALFLVPFFVFAASDRLQEEIDEGGKSIKLSKGTYTGDATLGKNVRLVGKDKSGVVITGKVIMSNGSKLEKLTIKGGSVYVKSGASVEIENVTIKNSHRNAIETSGSGKLTVKNSSIRSAGGKGFYIQAGKNVSISGNEIYKNREEGIDIRANVDGIISGNSVYNNGESGIEVILGKSELSISGNTVKNNGSSGIAAQYYETTNVLGTVKINSNKLSNNKKYGIDCSVPSKSETFVGTYWRRSMFLEANTFSGNIISAINRACGVSNSSSKSESVSNQNQQSEEVQVNEEVEKTDEQKEKERIEEEEKREQENRNKLEAIKNDFTQSKNKTEKNISGIKERNSLELFILGPKKKELSELKEENNKIKSYKDELNKLGDQIKNKEILSLSKDVESEIKNQDEVISDQENKFSLIDWLRDFFD